MKFLEMYQRYRDKQKFIERLRRIQMLNTVTTTQEMDIIGTFKTVFDERHIGYDERDLDQCESIVKQCTENGYDAFKAANIICEEMEIDKRWNRAHIEMAIKNNNLLN